MRGVCSSIMLGGANALAIAPIGWSIVGCGGGGEILGSIGSTVRDASSETFADGAIGSPDGAIEPDKDGDGTVDADLGPFSAPVLVPELSDPAAYDEDPSFTGDLLELYFTSSRAGTFDIWRSRRATPDDRWGAPARVAELSSPTSEETPSISLDGLTIWFASDRPASHKGKNLWVSSRINRESLWSAPSEVTELNSDSDDLAPATNGNDLIMAFASDRPGSAAHDIYFAGRAIKGAPWSAPVLVDSINS